MTDPITREQVERAIDQAVTGHFVIMPMHFGGDAWRDAIPDHVRSGYDVSFDALVRALTRWRDELAAAEPARPEPAEDSPERLPATCGDCKHYDGDRLCNAAAPKRTFTWGSYVPPDYCPLRVLKNANSSPERLRERREALGLSRRDMANLVLHRSICMNNVPEYANCWHPEDVRRCEEVPDAPAIYAQHRARYAAALSAAEAERVASKPHMTPAFRKAIVEMRAGGASLSEVADAYSLGIGEVSDALDAECVAPAPPAPEVVDVPQPTVKRCACPDIHDDVEAEWRPGEPYLTVTHTTVPLALLRAMLEAIDAQQGGAS